MLTVALIGLEFSGCLKGPRIAQPKIVFQAEGMLGGPVLDSGVEECHFLAGYQFSLADGTLGQPGLSSADV